MKTLNDLRLTKEGIICEIKNSGTIKRRLLDLGIMNGAIICPMLENPTRDMRAYRIQGTLIALRKEESSHIMIEERG